MPSNSYHFEDHWFVPFPIEDVWEVLSEATQFPSWWRQVYLSAVAEDSIREPHVGQRVAMVTKGWLPYKLQWTIETLRLDKPHLIEFKASGDFSTDASRWILRPSGAGTDVVLDWNPTVAKPVVRLLSPVLKPLFRWNHVWAMTLGQKQIAEHLHALKGREGMDLR